MTREYTKFNQDHSVYLEITLTCINIVLLLLHWIFIISVSFPLLKWSGILLPNFPHLLECFLNLSTTTYASLKTCHLISTFLLSDVSECNFRG